MRFLPFCSNSLQTSVCVCVLHFIRSLVYASPGCFFGAQIKFKLREKKAKKRKKKREKSRLVVCCEKERERKKERKRERKVGQPKKTQSWTSFLLVPTFFLLQQQQQPTFALTCALSLCTFASCSSRLAFDSRFASANTHTQATEGEKVEF